MRTHKNKKYIHLHLSAAETHTGMENHQVLYPFEVGKWLGVEYKRRRKKRSEGERQTKHQQPALAPLHTHKYTYI